MQTGELAGFVRVAGVSEIPDPGKAVFEVDDRFVVVFHVGGEFFAIDDCCTHDDGPLGEGQLDDHTIACPRHGAKFDIRTGRALTMPATRATASHEVRVAGDGLFIRLSDA